MTRVLLIIGGFVLLVIGVVVFGQSLATLLAAGFLSPVLIQVAGADFVETLASPFLWLVGGGVIALVGVGVVVAGFHVRRRGVPAAD
mgnify:FL=1